VAGGWSGAIKSHNSAGCQGSPDSRDYTFMD
jgi:hypothetical protein